jgi:hypothetical protein
MFKISRTALNKMAQKNWGVTSRKNLTLFQCKDVALRFIPNKGFDLQVFMNQ